jgi:putative ABC transport system permease protein
VLELGSDGNTNCWKTETIDSYKAFLNSECIWFHGWFELRTADKQRAFREFLDNYVVDQKKHGRFPRPLNNYLYDVDGWLKRNKVVEDDNKAVLVMAFAFLAVCLVNTIGLLLAKFLNGAPQSGVRRALGASRRDIFLQHLTESGVVALAGGIVGGLLGVTGIWALRAYYGRFVEDAPKLLPFDEINFVIVVAIAVFAGLIAGLYPAWRIGRAAPASTSRCSNHGNPPHTVGAAAQPRGRHPRCAADRHHAGHRRERHLRDAAARREDRPAHRHG